MCSRSKISREHSKKTSCSPNSLLYTFSFIFFIDFYLEYTCNARAGRLVIYIQVKLWYYIVEIL